ncbi:MAG: hypothetical protein JNL57_01035 [Bacteroidetes bacterium]|nr:hypothetical protein [Bacteroidota bacterium]
MKIACICNLNHAQFILARYLRDAGHDVTLFLIEELTAFAPEKDTIGDIKDIAIRQLPWKHQELNNISKQEIRDHLSGFDRYCCSEFGPAFLFKAGITADLFIPIGTDLAEYPFWKPSKRWPENWEIDRMQFVLFQKAGIRHSRALFMNKNGDMILESALNKIQFGGIRFPVSIPYLYMPDYLKAELNAELTEIVRKLRSQFSFIAVAHSRCEFLNPESIHYKGTDILLRGFANWIQKNDVSACLILAEYGTDVTAAKELINDLGIERNICWIPPTPRIQLFPLLKSCDVFIGNLSGPYWSYNTAMEAIAAGLPVIQHGNENALEAYPYLAAKSEQQLNLQLQKLWDSPETGISMGKEAQNWFSQRAIDLPVNELVKFFASGEVNRKPWWVISEETILWHWLNIGVRFLNHFVNFYRYRVARMYA